METALPLFPIAQYSLPAGFPSNDPRAEMSPQRAGHFLDDGTMLSTFPSGALTHRNTSVHTMPPAPGKDEIANQICLSLLARRKPFLLKNNWPILFLGTSPSTSDWFLKILRGTW